jgi:hypothetical protein
MNELTLATKLVRARKQARTKPEKYIICLMCFGPSDLARYRGFQGRMRSKEYMAGGAAVYVGHRASAGFCVIGLVGFQEQAKPCR